MSKKKLVVLALALVLIAVISVGATLAYFTDEDSAINTVTMGHVEIDLKEPNYKGGEDGGEVKDIIPGQIIDKDPTITIQQDSEDAYIRASLDVYKIVKDESGKVSEKEVLDEKMVNELMKGIDINAGWYYNSEDQYYYYNTRLKAGDSRTLFNKVFIPTTWDNDVVGMTFAIDVSAEAIQAEGFEPEKNDEGFITGWYYVKKDNSGNIIDKEAITVEDYVAPVSNNEEGTNP